MKNLKQYVTRRKADDVDFAKDYATGYEEFKIGKSVV